MSFFSRLKLSRQNQVFCDESSRWARQAFAEEGHPLAESDADAALLWIRDHYQSLYPVLGANQWINHFPNEQVLINKGELTANLKQFESVRADDGIPVPEFYQESYRLHDPEERRQFFDQLPKVDQRDNLWIYKPGDSSRGRGIEIMWRFSKLRRKLKPYGNRPITRKKEQGIVQRYIQNPLLLEGRKSEIRVYWMIASLDPFQVLVYPEATVRLNSLPFRLDQFDNQLIHVTNVYQQKNHPDFDPSVVLKWRFEELERYLVEDLALARPGFIASSLLPRIKQILSTVARAGRPGLYRDYPKRGGSFAVFGADMIIDENLCPWLTEIQLSPGLSFDDPIKKPIIPPMLGEAARIALEIRKRRIRGKTLHNLKSVNRYQWIHNEIQPELEPDLSWHPAPGTAGRRSLASPDEVALPA